MNGTDDNVLPQINLPEHRLLIACDCAADEPCGSWLELTPDGILVLEGSDDLRVTCALPDWLDAAMRYAIQRHKLKLLESSRLAIVFEASGSDRMTLPYITATLRDIFDSAAWVAHINDIPLHQVNVRFTDNVVTLPPTAATDDPSDALADDVPF